MKNPTQAKEIPQIIAPIILAVLVVVLVYINSLGTTSTSLFHLIFILLILSTSFLIVKLMIGKCNYIVITFVTLLFVLFCLRILSHIVAPLNILIGPDTKYELQIINNVRENGHLLTGTFTGEATGYRYFPATEIHILSISWLTGIKSTYLLKYTGIVLGIFFIIVVERFFFQLLKNRSRSIASAIIVGLCPFLVGMNSYTIHQSYGLIFLALFLWSYMHNDIKWRIISVISIAGIITSHSLTTYIFIIICLLVLVNSFIISRRFRVSIQKIFSKEKLYFILIILGSSLLYILLFTPPILKRVFNRIYDGITGNVLTPSNYTLSTVAPTYLKPAWVVAIQIFGFAIYGILVLFVAIWVFKKRKHDYGLALSFAGAGLIIFTIFLFLWIIGLDFAQEIQWRGLIYLYLFTAPLFVVSLRKIFKIASRYINNIFPSDYRNQLMILILILIITPTCLNSVYHGVVPQMYDNDVPLSYGDHRLPQSQWLAAAEYSSPHEDLDYSFGVRLSWEYVGSYGYKNILPLNFTDNLYEWTQNNSGRYVFLRKSIISSSDYGEYSPTISEFDRSLSANDLIYSSDEVIIIKNR
jgi:hypothetical protein